MLLGCAAHITVCSWASYFVLNRRDLCRLLVTFLSLAIPSFPHDFQVLATYRLNCPQVYLRFLRIVQDLHIESISPPITYNDGYDTVNVLLDDGEENNPLQEPGE